MQTLENSYLEFRNLKNYKWYTFGLKKLQAIFTVPLVLIVTEQNFYLFLKLL
jgi:hypothetical protein